MQQTSAILETQALGFPKRSGKVRDVYDLGDRIVLVATDRISAFDWVFSNGAPGKGKILTAMSLFWFRLLDVPNHVLSDDLSAMGPAFSNHPEVFAGRSVLAKKLKIVPFECVARGYLAGSGWKEYQKSGTVCGIKLPVGLRESDRLPAPIFTPATKAETGHDENVSFDVLVASVGGPFAETLRDQTLSLYRKGVAHAEQRGILLADTKFEFGLDNKGHLHLADEALTPDSSRFWPMNTYRPGKSQVSYDKQFVRDWLESIGFDKQSPPPPLPEEVIQGTLQRYQEALDRLTGPPSPC